MVKVTIENEQRGTSSTLLLPALHRDRPIIQRPASVPPPAYYYLNRNNIFFFHVGVHFG
jgi:hypothetical protein